MDSITVNKFRDKMKSYVEQVIKMHEPLKVTRRGGADFVVVSAEDWAREQETLYVLQNKELMKQIAESMRTHGKGEGYQPTAGELDEIVGV
jgi:antitoxin YefM